MKWEKDRFWVTDDNTLADIEFIHSSLQNTYWAAERPRQVVIKSLENSVLLSLFHNSRQIGFIRIISDYVIHAWLGDLYVDPGYRGKGLGKWLFECCLEHPATKVRSIILMTADAHDMYARYGFEKVECMRLKQDKY
jgi:GNAT superfamily N-acetyltransferase